MRFSPTRPECAAPDPAPASSGTELAAPHIEFVTRLESTPYGARAARQFAVAQLALWGVPQPPGLSGSVAIVTAELAANAVLHAQAPDEKFELRMAFLGDRVRIEVTDPSPQLPLPSAPADAPDSDAISGRGLLLVAVCADRWGWVTIDRPPAKCVWAEITLAL